ncbi:endo-1,4-beta-xylanase [Paenibacillus chartarius]|uniref:Beta-xylanase n=1 Tax=Paenibacillus chartarius TaxID=747481 RepID=A0ABV6DVC9_9BACL
MSRLLKRVLSILLAAALLPSGLLVPNAKAAVPEIPVLLYHRIVSAPTNDWTDTSVDKFRSTMKYLHDNGYTTLTSEQYVNIMNGTATTVPAKPILLTFDDGTPDLVTNALPILNEYNMNAVAFIVTGWIGGDYSMSLPQLQDIAANHPNISLENHTVNHANNTWNSMTQEAASAELAQANAYLKQITGKAPVLLAYPYGHYHADVKAAAEANGMKYAFKVGYPNEDSYAMGRHYVRMGTTLNEIAGWLGGPAPTPEDTVTVYHESFTSGKGAATQSGGANLAAVTGSVYDDTDGAALYVSNRTNNWDGADFKFAGIGLQNGKTYTVTVKGYVYSGEAVPAGAQAYLQTVNSYAFLAGADLAAGNAFTLTKEFTVDTSKDTALRVQSNDAGASVPFYIRDVLITEKAAAGGGDDNRPPAIPFAAITFEDQQAGGFAGRAGTETLTITNEANHTAGGSYALKVENRTNTWHGPVLRVEKYVDKGFEYKVSVWVKLISPASSQLQLSTQVGDGSSANYVNLAPKTISTSDGWVLFEGTYRYNNVSGEYLTIYVESSNNSTASFYIDDISFASTGSGPVSIQKDLTPIKTAYRNEFLIGNAISAEDLEGVRLELLKLHHNAATAGNAMKPDALQPAKGDFTFDAADAMVNKVLAEGMNMHGHVLVWHQQSPAWMNTAKDAQNNTIPLGREEALVNLRTHIRTVMEHFGGRVISWDVVNEAMNDNPSNPADWKAALRRSPWYQAIGPDYVEQAFLAAREVLDEHPDWNIKLYYNDYNEDNQNKAQAIYSMVKELNERYARTHPGKLLIDGVGMQAHYNVNTNPENVKLSLEKFISLGVTVSITELDIQAGSNYQLSEKLAIAQGYLYAQLLDIFKAHAAHIERVTFWGMDDNTSWRASANPLLFDKNLQAKPAYYGVIDPDKFMAEHQPDTAHANQSTAKYGTPVIDGTVDSVWSDTYAMPVNRYQMAWQGASGVAKALWDDRHLYVLIQVSDAQLDKSSPNAWEQDSVEIFVDRNNAKTSFYQDDDGQYRVNFAGDTSFNPAAIEEGFVSAAKVTGTNYTIEAKIPLKDVTPANGKKIGFDVQINDGKDGSRQSVAAWNDTTGNGYMDTSVYGVLTLVGKAASPDPDSDSGTGTETGTGGGNPGTGGSGTAPGQVPALPANEVKATVDASGKATADIGEQAFAEALKRVKAGRIAFEIVTPGEVKAVAAKLPADRVKAAADAGVKRILVDTGFAKLELPSSLLTGSDHAAEVELSVSKVEPADLPEPIRSRVGSNAVFDFNLSVGGERIREFGAGQTVQVSIPYTLKAGENPGQVVICYISDNGTLEVVKNGRYNPASGTVEFKAKHFSKYAAVPVEVRFSDLARMEWAAGSISALAARGIVDGVSDASFAPEKDVTRAEFVQLLVRTLDLHANGANGGGNPFSDVEQGEWYYEAVLTAHRLGIVNGVKEGFFGVQDLISREDMAVMIYRAMAAARLTLEPVKAPEAFADGADIAGYAQEAVAALQQAGMINGMNEGEFAPKAAANRAQAAAMLHQLLYQT